MFLPQKYCLLKEMQIKLLSLNRVVVAGNWIRHDVRVAVGVDDGRRGNAALGRVHDGVVVVVLLVFLGVQEDHQVG